MEILEAVKKHHEYVREQGYEVVMTTLIGSQNYLLDNDNSDIDTFTFILPSEDNLYLAYEPISGEFQIEDGKCMYKDIRLALNLLKKTSPNSIECFTSTYRYYEPKYADILSKYLNNEYALYRMVHCNYSHMLYAMVGMARQLTKRNMPAGKRYSHALRLWSMKDTFLNGTDTSRILHLLPRDYQEALHAKRDTNETHNAYYNDGCVSIADELDKFVSKFKQSPEEIYIEKDGINLIESLQYELMRYYYKHVL